MTPKEWWLVFDAKVREANAQRRAQEKTGPNLSDQEREYLLGLID